MRFKFFTFILFLITAELCWCGQSLSGNVSCFVPLDSTFNKIYHENPFYQLDYIVDLKKEAFTTSSDLLFFGSLGYLYGSGKTNQGSHTHIHYLPLSFGGNLSFRFKNDKLIPYIGLGPVISYSRVHNDVGDSCSLDRNQNGWGWGGRVRSGVFAKFSPSFFTHFFTDYYLTKVFYHYSISKTIKNQCYIHGISVGFGIGYKF